MLQIITFKHAPCPTCGGVVVGRTDKRFCCIKCKNEHHRVARALFKPRFKEIQRKILRNLVVAEGILGTKHSAMSIHKDALFRHGFDLSVCTGTTVINDKLVHELHDYHFHVRKDGIVVVKRTKQLKELMPVFFKRWAIDFPEALDVGIAHKGIKVKDLQLVISRWNE